MPLSHLLLLILAGAGAGFVNAIAGGGTILTFPALILVGVDSIHANATSTVALILGIGGGVYGYRGHLAPVRHWLLDFAPISVLGGLLGALLLTHTPTGLFDKLVPFLLLFATILFMAHGWLASHLPSGPEPGRPHWSALGIQFLVSVYGGYFGAGIGILMLAVFGLFGLRNLNQMNAIKTVLGALVNIVAALYFIGCGLIDWPKMLLIAGGALPGYYLGSLYSQNIPAARARQIVSAIGLAIAGYFFYRIFGGK